MILKNYKQLLLISLFTLLFLPGCITYSFTGTNIDPSIKTMTIRNFENNSGQGPAFLTNLVSEQFRTYFQRNTNLKLLPTGGDVELEGQILSYNVSPAAIQKVDGRDIAGQNRLTISVKVHYINNKDSKQDFEQTFSSFQDFPQSSNIMQLDDRSIQGIVERVVQDVFNKSLANW
ncbi:LptE family protein [Adhaeribacter aquaticus]|uniref:LptE family protein n=1 Tax=Adhaeribacter aquaticus TaxID=299567 RepID=UPI00047CCD4C|nr:LptE family protein [Adhaeribacter aquaticus]